MSTDPVARFLAALSDALSAGQLHKLTLGGPEDPEAPKQLLGRLVDLKGGRQLQLVERYPTRDRTSNHPLDARALEPWLARFRNADLFTSEAIFRLERRPGKPARLRVEGASHAGPPPTQHDRAKSRGVGGPEDAGWMSDLGLTDPSGRPRREADDKLRQVHRFVEILGHQLADWPKEAPIRVVDMGCGKGYLTAAVAVWLARSGFVAAEVIGVELRPHLVEAGNQLAARHQLPGLRFVAASIAEAPLEGADVVIALHACDTATDDALARAAQAGARLILASPCCHRQLRPQLQAPAAFAGAARHGIFLEREAELLTDALRADLLGAVGYDARVFEFVPSEHTPRNCMIAANLREGVDRDRRRAEAQALASAWSVRDQALAAALGVPLTTP